MTPGHKVKEEDSSAPPDSPKLGQCSNGRGRIKRSAQWLFDQNHPARQILVVIATLLAVSLSAVELMGKLSPESPDDKVIDHPLSSETGDQKQSPTDILPFPQLDFRHDENHLDGLATKPAPSSSSSRRLLFRADYERYSEMVAKHNHNCSQPEGLSLREQIKCESTSRLIAALSNSYNNLINLACQARSNILKLGDSNNMAEYKEDRDLADRLAHKYSIDISRTYFQFDTSRESYQHSELSSQLTSEYLFAEFFKQTDPLWRESIRALRFTATSPPKINDDFHARNNQIRLMVNSISGELAKLCRVVFGDTT